MHVVGFLAMLTTFWADKFSTCLCSGLDWNLPLTLPIQYAVFLRITRSPPLYDGKVANAAGSMLPYAVLMHCLVAMWMYSNEMIFQSVRAGKHRLAALTLRLNYGCFHSVGERCLC